MRAAFVMRDNLRQRRTIEQAAPQTLAAAGDRSQQLTRVLRDALHDRKAPIKAMLLNQNIVAGLGNIYVCEALHMAGIDPRAPASSISKPRLVRLVVAIKEVLTAAIAAGGSTLRDFAAPDGELGYFAKDWRVYGREGQDCVCGAPVQRRVDSGRSTFYCAKCQR